jgi:hypothetical protein
VYEENKFSNVSQRQDPHCPPSSTNIEYALFFLSHAACAQGTTQVGAAFEVGMAMVSFSYYLLLSHEPRYQTFTWTLDYRYSSDFGMYLVGTTFLATPTRLTSLLFRRGQCRALAGHAPPHERVRNKLRSSPMHILQVLEILCVRLRARVRAGAGRACCTRAPCSCRPGCPSSFSTSSPSPRSSR